MAIEEGLMLECAIGESNLPEQKTSRCSRQTCTIALLRCQGETSSVGLSEKWRMVEACGVDVVGIGVGSEEE
jgi:hypothetical protein